VRVYSLFCRETISWFEMEFVDGCNLNDELIRALAHLPMERRVEISLAVTRGLWHAHRRGVLHRDVKPANVLLPTSGDPPAKLGDFGIARVESQSDSTPRGAIVGPPLFASPEALAGQAVGPAHDVYGLASTLYMLFSGGHTPHPRGRSERCGTFANSRDSPPIPISTLVPNVDHRVGQVVMSALRPNPEQRPGLGTLVRALEVARNSGSFVLRPSTARPWRMLLGGVARAAAALWGRARPSDR